MRNTMSPSPFTDVNGDDIYEGDVVKGIGKNVGQSEVFFAHGRWQPFSYLDDCDGNNYQIVKEEGILYPKSINKKIMTKSKTNIYVGKENVAKEEEKLKTERTPRKIKKSRKVKSPKKTSS